MRRVVNQFMATKPTGGKVVVQEWCRHLAEIGHGKNNRDIRLVTTLGEAVYYDQSNGSFRLIDGTPLSSDDPQANETRRRLTIV